MVKQLLQLLICVVDAELLKAVQVEDLETRNVEDSDEAGALTLGSVKRPVDPRHDPLEEPLVGGLADGLHSELDLLLGLGLGHVVAANLDSGLEEGLGEVGDLDAEQMRDLLGHGVVGERGLVGVALLLELHVPEEEAGADDAPDGGHVLLADAHDPHRVLGGRELLHVVNPRDPHTAHGHEGVVLGIVQQHLS